jgi:hypothetical protein
MLLGKLLSAPWRLCAGLGLGFVAAAPGVAVTAADPHPLTRADHRLLDELERASFRYFAEQTHPLTGLVRDRARADGSASEGKASIAASGFSIGAWVIAAERGWVSKPEAADHVRSMLHFLATRAPRQHGFFYHFMEMDSGVRAWQCELSSIDSSLLYAGAILAREYFADPSITALTNQLLAEVDWEWFRNDGQLIALGWHDEWGFSRYRWNNYSEHVLMSFLALGVSGRPLGAEYWQSWLRRPVGRYGRYTYVQEPPLFVHQFPQAFVDLRGRRDAQLDYFHNTRLATLAQRQFCMDLRDEFPAWGENLWGLTASDSVTDYKAWGGPPRTRRHNALDGTIVPCAAAGSLPFAPAEALAVLHHLRDQYGDRIWHRYGFADAFNPHTGWVASDVIGIDLGVSMLQAENLRTGLIWRLFMQAPEVRQAMRKAGFLSTSTDLDEGQRLQLRDWAAAAWASLQAQPAEAGLQLTALVAAARLDLVSAAELSVRARTLLQKAQPPIGDVAALARYAAALVVLRQAVPVLAPEATRLLEQVDWSSAGGPANLGDAARLAVFLQVAGGRLDASAWNNLARTTTPVGPVRVLAPVDASGALLPGLWLDERSILPGAAAAQLAYAGLTGHLTGTGQSLQPALQLAHFPREMLGPSVPRPAVSGGAAAALVIAAANLLATDNVRDLFQRDPLVQAGRGAIPEFGEAAFGPDTSIIAQRELSVMPPAPPVRTASAVAHSQPPDTWVWQTVAGPEFLDTNADVRPGDAPLQFRFAFTWDQSALYLHAVVEDTPAGYQVPAFRERGMELFVDPAGDGLMWSGEEDYQFTYLLGAAPQEMFHGAASTAQLTPSAQGYSLEAVIPWASLGISPKPGLVVSLSPAAFAKGTREWESTMKLNWSYAPMDDGSYRLGQLRLD